MVQFKLNKFWTEITLAASICFYIASLAVVIVDKNFTYRWLGFWLHIAAVVLIVILYLNDNFDKKYLRKISKSKDLLAFGIILGVTVLINSLFITVYPFVSIGDELRDGGLNAMQIATGTLPNIFAYGIYSAHGLIIPTITSFFYTIFGNSVLTYRIPAALLACLDVAIIFVLVRLLFNRTIAFFSAIVLATMPLHMFYARTQVVVAFNIFLSSIILLALYFFLKKQQTTTYIFLGTLLGFAFGFHAAIRVVAILILLLVIGISLYSIVNQLIKRKYAIQSQLLNILLLIVFCFVGFGPRLLFTDSSVFFHISRLEVQPNRAEFLTFNNVETIKQNYLKSLMVWYYEPTTFDYPDHKPLYPPFLAILFLLGVGYSIFIIKKKYLFILMYLAVTVPLLSSAITDTLNADHRISTLLPVGSVFVGIGIYYIFTLFRHKYIHFFIGVIITLYLLFQVMYFFNDRPADKDYMINDYLSMHVIQLLKSQPSSTGSNTNSDTPNTNICLFVSPDFATNLRLSHYKEQYAYFLPNYSIQIEPNANINDNEAYVLFGNCTSDYTKAAKQQVKTCRSSQNDYLCPRNYDGDITIHY